MPVAFPSPASVLERIYDKGSADYLNRANTHHARASELTTARTRTTDEGVAIHYESPQQLRECAHENELAEHCHALFMTSIHWRNRALWKSYRHAQLCEIRNRHTVTTRVITLAEVAQTFTTREKLSRDHAPPGELSRPVLSLCHASNAPGLTAMPSWRHAPPKP